MLFLHYVNDLLMFLLMRCSIVPFILFLLEGEFVILVIKSLFSLSFFLPQVLFFLKGHPLKSACLTAYQWSCEFLEVLNYPHEETLTSFKRFFSQDISPRMLITFRWLLLSKISVWRVLFRYWAILHECFVLWLKILSQYC